MRYGFLFVTFALSAQTSGPITFDDVTDTSKVRFVTHNSATPERQQPESILAGAAVLDFDGDGLLDLYFVNGAGMPSLKKEGSKHSNRLFRNNGDGTFTDVTVRAGVAGAGYGMGVAVGDFDNDGWPDIYLANLNANQLFRNNGNGTFTDVTAKAGVAGGVFEGKKMWAVAAAWVDYDNDGKLDLFVSNYCQWDPANPPDCREGEHRIYCSPRHFKPLPHSLYRNLGNGSFKDVSAETGLAKHLGRGMGVAIADYDDDGFMDVFVANDDAPLQLFHNLGGKRFEEVSLEAGVQFPESGNVISGMGVDFRDVFNNGRPAAWVTAIEKETFPLFANQGEGQFVDGTAAAGLALETFNMSGWSNAIVDLDNDGWKDLVTARSNVQDNVALYSPRTFEEPLALFRNLGSGRFQNVAKTAGETFQKPGGYRGLAVGDLDNDGREDLAVTVLNGAAKIFRNTSVNGNHWILLKLQGTKSNRMGIGAKIRVTTADDRVQHNHATTSAGFACSSDVRVHFGLGSSAAVKEIEIRWPSGRRQVLRDISGDRVVTVVEPAN